MATEVPDTAPYRVVIAGAIYDAPRVTYDPQGEEQLIYVSQFATRAEVIDLVGREADRLTALGAIRPAESEKGYDEMTDAELRATAEARGVVVRSSGADPDQPLPQDYVNALITYDQGSVAVSSAPGGVSVGNVTTVPVVEEDAPDAVTTPGGVDARGASAGLLAEAITAEKLNASDTVALAGDDPALAAKVLEAEGIAQAGDPRASVVKPLQQIIDG